MSRVMLLYPDNTKTYSYFTEGESGTFFVLGGQRYTVDDIRNTGAIAIVNNAVLLRKFSELGMPCRPTARQHIITISVSCDTQERLKKAAKAKKRKISSIMEELAIEWLNKNDM